MLHHCGHCIYYYPYGAYPYASCKKGYTINWDYPTLNGVSISPERCEFIEGDFEKTTEYNIREWLFQMQYYFSKRLYCKDCSHYKESHFITQYKKWGWKVPKELKNSKECEIEGFFAQGGSPLTARLPYGQCDEYKEMI